MFWTIIALAMTVLMGGIIAYNGDLIGRKYGKKRLSMFGLRPKHTAILITSITGVLISALTTATIFLLAPPVRKVILEGERAIRDLPKLQLQTKNLTIEKSRRILELETARDDLRAARADLGAARSQLKTAAGSLSRVTAQLTRVEGQKQQAEQSLRTAEAARRTAELRTNELRRQVEPLKWQARELAAGNVKLKDDNDRLVGLNKQLSARTLELSVEVNNKAEENRKYDMANKELASQNERIVRENRTLTDQNAHLAREQELLKKITSDLYAGAAELEEKNRRLAGENESLAQENKRLVSESSQLKQVATMSVSALYATLEALRTRPVAVHTGEDLARVTIAARSTPAEVRDSLKQLTREASEAAKVKGADAGERSTMLAVQIVDKRTLARTPFGVREVSISEEEQMNQIIAAASNSDVPVCVLAMAAGNSVRGEPAIIDLQPLADRLVYPRGRMVARSKKLNANRPPETVFMDLVEFLKDVGRTAVERGMIPRVDPATGEPQVGALEWPERVRLVERVRGAGRSVQVSAVAAGDTSASGPLKLEFKVEGAL